MLETGKVLVTAATQTCPSGSIASRDDNGYAICSLKKIFFLIILTSITGIHKIGSSMNIFIFVDMEGISGISGSEFVTPDGCHYQAGREYYTWDIGACIRGCKMAGADRIIVRDGHGSGNHAIWDELEPGAELIQGMTPTRMPGMAECDALILLGYHARAGTPGALLEHTYSSKSVQNMWLNDRLVGEIGIDAAIGADSGVPTILVSGDDATCREAADWIPGVVTCEVKQGMTCQGAKLLPLDVAHKLIEDATVEAIKKIGQIAPITVEHPVTLRKEVIERGSVPSPLGRTGFRIIDGRTFEVTRDTVEEAMYGLF
jgi:D-amino peptidase